jgi:hypothetical protein
MENTESRLPNDDLSQPVATSIINPYAKKAPQDTKPSHHAQMAAFSMASSTNRGYDAALKVFSVWANTMPDCGFQSIDGVTDEHVENEEHASIPAPICHLVCS